MKSGRSQSRPERRRLAHRRPRGLGYGRGRRLPPGRRDPRRHARGPAGRRRAALAPARPRGARGRGADECRRAGDPLRRRLRGRRVSSFRSSGRTPCDALAAALPAEASVANPVDMLGSATAERLRAALPLVLADPRHRRRHRPVRAAGRRRRADEVGAAISRATAAAASRTSPCSPRPLRDGSAGDAARRRRPVVPLSGGRRPRARPRRRATAWLRRSAGTVPSSTDIDRAAARRSSSARARATTTRHGSIRLRPAGCSSRYGLPLVGERVAATADEAVAAAARARLPGRRQDRRRRGAQDGDGRRRARPRGRRRRRGGDGAHRRARDRAADDHGRRRAPRRAWRRIPSSAPSSPSAPGACSPSSSAMRRSASRRSRTSTPRSSSAAGKAGRLVAGFRGAPAADAAALADLLHRLSRLADDLPAAGRARPQSRARPARPGASSSTPGFTSAPRTRSCAPRAGSARSVVLHRLGAGFGGSAGVSIP